MKGIRLLIALIIVVSLVSACGTPEPEKVEIEKEVTRIVEMEVEKVVEATAAPAEEPTEFKMVTFHSSQLDSAWERGMIQAVERVTASQPHGLTIIHEAVEKVSWSDAERIIRNYARTGEYDLIYLNTGYRDAACILRDEFPDQLFSIKTSPGPFDCFEGGKNLYFLNSSIISECSFLAGVLAGHLTESNIIGVTASMQTSEINESINAFVSGAKYVNPDIKAKVTFIETWFDLAKARDAAEAQLNVGADFIFQIAEGTLEAVAEHGAYAATLYVDQSYLAPDNVVTSVMGNWDAGLLYLIDEWWNHQVYGVPYSAPSDKISYSLRDGSCELYEIPENLVDAEIIQAVMELQQQIENNALMVDSVYEQPVSDQ